MKIDNLNALDVAIRGKDIFSLIKEGDVIRLVRFEPDLDGMEELASFRGSRAFLLTIRNEESLVSVDDALVLVREGVQKIVHSTNVAGNFFWHAAEAEGYTFVQEYGQPPTGIYVSEDLKDWKKIVTNVELDKYSKHFHYIAWDLYRRWLVATLGDGCLNRVVYSEDLGHSWKPLYRGAWQFLPITPLKDMIVFGMDSGIARGGVGVYYPSRGKWKFIFLRWCDGRVRFAQMADLKRLNCGIYVSALGTPQVILVSEDLRNWYLAHMEGLSEGFNFHMRVSEGSDIVASSTGTRLLIFRKNELENIFQTKPVMSSYKPFLGRLKGTAFTMRRKFDSLVGRYA